MRRFAHSQPGAELHLASREEHPQFRDFSGVFHKRSLFRELLLHGQDRVQRRWDILGWFSLNFMPLSDSFLWPNPRLGHSLSLVKLLIFSQARAVVCFQARKRLVGVSESNRRGRTHSSSLISIQEEEGEGKIFVSMGRKRWSSCPIMDEKHLWQSDHDISPCSSSRSYPYKTFETYSSIMQCQGDGVCHHPLPCSWWKEKEKCYLHDSSTLTKFLHCLKYSSSLKKLSYTGQRAWVCRWASENLYCCHISPSTSLASDTTGEPQGAPKVQQLFLIMPCLELDTAQVVSSPLLPQAP